MTVELHVDASDFEHLGRAIARLPEEIKAKAAARAMRRVTEMARSRIVKRDAERIDIPPSRVRAVTTAQFNAGGNTSDVVVRSGWIPLYKLGATQTAKGVRVRLRGSYRSAFIAEMKSGHAGVFRRQGKARLPIRELFGPNPAHDITNNPEVYLQVLTEVIEQNLMPRYLHEVDRLLPR
ncbi:phage tail protein [Mesorhizobium sp. ISC25]|uniref:phage tail protein n=1 Tax=Mesorhizobium sp. ISC25 TaxID=3077335 RepID=UPI0035D7A0DF